ncbi:MAG: hypothetical protein Q4G68_03750 [Planctomycetia bacterium]|nr:hypothetical protein [Planctomycetia bacterium]
MKNYKTLWFGACAAAIFAAAFSCSTARSVEIPLALNTIQGNGSEMPKTYVPPVVSNGSVSMQVDWTASQRRQYSGVWKAGRRYPNPGASLIPFGWFEHFLTSDDTDAVLNSWSQTLHVREGFVSSVCHYSTCAVETTLVTPLDKDIIAIRHKITSTAKGQQKIKLSFVYHLCPPLKKEGMPDKMLGNWSWNAEEQFAEFNYTVFGHPTSEGSILITAGQELRYGTDKQTAVVSSEFPLAEGESKEVVFYVIYADSIDGANYREMLANLHKYVNEHAYDDILASNTQLWNEYLSQSEVNIPEESIQRMYDTAQYRLRVNATRWSFPVGIAPQLWHGRYFGWDEMFCHQGLVTSNHLAIAQRCPDFRKAILNVATYRVGHYGRPGKYGAKYVWEAMEDGSEGSPPGFWYDHIFNMSNVARSAWTQYLYSDDLDWLKTTGFPVILECARYFHTHWVYEDSNGELYIGKCTDLERLGPARDRPFMTTCGAIYAMRAAADAAELVGESSDETKEMRLVADKLEKFLPNDGNAYIGYKDCKEDTIATLGGLFPYDIFDASNTLQKNAAYKYIREGRKNGNMYPVGNSVCPWYAGKMAAAMAILEDREEPVKLMREAAGSVGHFGELYEINEPAIVSNPWFTTAAGNCVYAINQMLIHCKEKKIILLCGVPDAWQNFSFRLPAYGGIMVDAAVENGCLVRLDLHANYKDRVYEKTLTIPERWVKNCVIRDDAVKSREIIDGKIVLGIQMHGDISLITSKQK